MATKEIIKQFTIETAQEVLEAASVIKHGKFEYATTKFVKQVQKALQKKNEAYEDLEIEHCSLDESNKNILLDEKGNKKFSREATRILKNFARKKDQEPFDVNIYICPITPFGLTEYQLEVLDGVLIDRDNPVDTEPVKKA